MRATLAFALLGAANADVYMQYPPGSNNRLDEGGGNRNNNNRLMDTQNNAKGGYGYGGDANNQAAAVNYMVGSKLSMGWTSQHSCGSGNAECQVVIQYMCNDAATAPAGTVTPAGRRLQAAGPGEGPLRDGTNNNAPDPDNPQANRGLHEPTSFYQACNGRERNKGLYTADQNLNNNDATRTRQNPNGARSALECPEERDYYPYWAPSPWKDLVVMTNNLALCEFYQQNSQNVAAKGYCTGGDTGNGNQPNNEAQCTGTGGTWNVVAPFGIPPPECVTAPVTRDNHLGNDQTGNEVFANLTVPASAGGAANDAQNCAMRLRYNITTGDTRACSIKASTTEAACVAAGGVWSSFYVDSSYDDSTLASNPPLPEGNPTVGVGGVGGGGGTDSLLELAINTNQYGRTFQDRTHVFSIQSRPAGVPESANIYNLNVKGKRGNIVQTYPATEYDFHPVDVAVGSQDMLHIQWTGNDNTNNNGNNNGEGTDNEDRHNIVQLSDSALDQPATADQAKMFDVMWEWNSEAAGQFAGARPEAALTKQAALAKQTGCAATGDVNNDQQRTNCEKLNNAAATVDLGLMRMKAGTYKYMSSRNNNFSNRAQKASITTLAEPSALPKRPTNVQVVAVENPENPEAAKVTVSWGKPGEETPYKGIDGKEYVGYSQDAKASIAYMVQYSCDGGTTWVPTNCQSAPTEAHTRSTCAVENLPAGTTCAFQVKSGSTGGWSTASETAVVQTVHSEASEACQEQLLNQVNGNSLSTASVAGIVGGIVVFLCLALAIIYFCFCKKKNKGDADALAPPPPPGGMPEYTPQQYNQNQY